MNKLAIYKTKAIQIILFAIALSRHKMSWWHMVIHLFDKAQETYDLYFKEEDETSVYECYRCNYCNFARNEMAISKSKFNMPLAFNKEDIKGK